MTDLIKSPKKLIEVALPLDAINTEAALRKRKAPGGYPTTLHKWWAQRPVAAARAVIFAQMVNDPGGERGYFAGMTKAQADAKREDLFDIIRDLVKWENTNDNAVLDRARAAIRASWEETCRLNKSHPRASELFNPERLPAFHDPFAGSGAIPLEAKRLGLQSFASDLNPVAVMINKAMIDIPARFAGRAPVGPSVRGGKQAKLLEDWSGAQALAEDVRRYGAWMREQAANRIGHLYPKIMVTAEMAAERPNLKHLIGTELEVIAWLWARTVKSPNPAFSHVEVPLVSTFVLSSKSGKETYVSPEIHGDTYKFAVHTGIPPVSANQGTSAGKRGGFYCLLSRSPIDYKYIRAEGSSGRMRTRLMAIVAEGPNGRIYLPPTDEQEAIANQAQASWKPDVKLHGKSRVNVSNYGLDVYGDLFTQRQLSTLTTFSDLIGEVIGRCREDAALAGLDNDDRGLEEGGKGALAYAEAVGVYLACAISRLADYGCSLATWRPKDNAMRSSLPKQALQMSWDFAEGSPFASSSSGFLDCCGVVAKVIETALSGGGAGHAFQHSATSPSFPAEVRNAVISTDPPYYDNISYADLSDFLYVWLRRCLRSAYPTLFATLAVPKAEELVATPYRHDSKEEAERFFTHGMTDALQSLVQRSHPAFPVSIYYAFKQSETTDDGGTSSTGWETFLQAVVDAGFSVTGTWPMRTEGDNRQVGNQANALASSIVLVCRPRPDHAATVNRREFIRELNAALPEALDEMTQGGVNSPVAPVDLSQAILGPGMAIFSQYAAVLEADGTPMTVKTALQLINRFLAEDDFDHDTQFCLHWFEQQGWATGRFGEADVLARAKGTSVAGLQTAGVWWSSNFGHDDRFFRCHLAFVDAGRQVAQY
jgi:putative DNA methylase